MRVEAIKVTNGFLIPLIKEAKMIFVDTGAWIALSDKSDQHHNEAVAIYQKLKRKKDKIMDDKRIKNYFVFGNFCSTGKDFWNLEFPA